MNNTAEIMPSKLENWPQKNDVDLSIALRELRREIIWERMDEINVKFVATQCLQMARDKNIRENVVLMEDILHTIYTTLSYESIVLSKEDLELLQKLVNKYGWKSINEKGAYWIGCIFGKSNLSYDNNLSTSLKTCAYIGYCCSVSTLNKQQIKKLYTHFEKLIVGCRDNEFLYERLSTLLKKVLSTKGKLKKSALKRLIQKVDLDRRAMGSGSNALLMCFHDHGDPSLKLSQLIEIKGMFDNDPRKDIINKLEQLFRKKIAPSNSSKPRRHHPHCL